MLQYFEPIISYNTEITSGPSFEEWTETAWTDWIEGKYRELIVTITREYKGDDTGNTFTVRKEIYSWNDKHQLYLAERTDDGKVVFGRSNHH